MATLYEAARRGEISPAEGIERVTRINSLKVRFLGDKVLQRQAWKLAEQLGWDTTYDAEYVALARLQADFSSPPTGTWSERSQGSSRPRGRTRFTRPERDQSVEYFGWTFSPRMRAMALFAATAASPKPIEISVILPS